jgi:hypothetical protein
MSTGSSAAARSILLVTGSAISVVRPNTSLFLQLFVFQGTAHFRDLTFHLADRQVSPTGTCPIDEKQLFKTTVVIYMYHLLHHQ